MKPVDLRRNEVSIATIHDPYQLTSRSIFFLFPYIPRIQSTYTLLSSLGNFNEGGTQFPQESERLELNLYNQILSLQLMGLLGIKYILR